MQRGYPSSERGAAPSAGSNMALAAGGCRAPWRRLADAAGHVRRSGPAAAAASPSQSGASRGRDEETRWRPVAIRSGTPAIRIEPSALTARRPPSPARIPRRGGSFPVAACPDSERPPEPSFPLPSPSRPAPRDAGPARQAAQAAAAGGGHRSGELPGSALRGGPHRGAEVPAAGQQPRQVGELGPGGDDGGAQAEGGRGCPGLFLRRRLPQGGQQEERRQRQQQHPWWGRQRR